MNNRLYKTYDETTLRIDTGADLSVIRGSEKHDELLDVVTVEDFEGNSRNKHVWRKDKINGIIGHDNLL